MKLSPNGRANIVATIFFLGSMAVAVPIEAQDNYDAVITNGRVMDPESGLDAVRNVGILAGKIRAISTGSLVGKTKIDAKGLVIAPGFIDLHQHGQDAENDRVKAADGVTTSLELEVGVADVDSWYAARAKNALINFGASVGHIPVRMAVMHDPGGLLPAGDAAHRPATAAELEQIQAGIEKGLHRGALAVGLGPAYTAAATNWEILEVFQIAARYGASVHVHIRGSTPAEEGNLTGFQEVLSDAVATGAPLHVVHIQSTGGLNVVHELDMIRGARARGLDVTAEAYPYDHGMTALQSALFDNKEDAPDSYFASLLWPDTGEHLTRDPPRDDAGNGPCRNNRPADHDCERRHTDRREGPSAHGGHVRACPRGICAPGKSTVADGCAAQDDVDARAKAGETCTGLPRQRPDSHWGRRGYYRIRSRQSYRQSDLRSAAAIFRRNKFRLRERDVGRERRQTRRGSFPWPCCTGAYRACEVALEKP